MSRFLRNNFLTPAPPPPTREKPRTLADLTVLGIIINPKTKRPVLSCTDGSYVSIRGLDAGPERIKVLGRGYYDRGDYPAATDATDLPRVHTPDGVTIKGLGYGTSLYTALCLGAHLTDTVDGFRIKMRGDGSGISSDTDNRSREADDWWAAAIERGLTNTFEAEEEETEENVDIDVSATELDSCTNLDEGKISYVNRVNVDIVKTTEKIFDYYNFESAASHHLVVLATAVEVPDNIPSGADLDFVWRYLLSKPEALFEDNLDKVALLGLDVRDLDPDVVDLLSLAYIAAGLGDNAVDEMRLRWENKLDPGEQTRQLRLFSPNSGPGFRAVIEAREESGWDNLEDLP
jgi:hypothetical protein